MSKPAPYSTLRLERNGAIATLTLARASHANALDLTMSRDLLHAAIELDEDPAVRAVILTGEGKMFCAGGDLAAMKEAGSRAPAYIKELAGNLHLAISRLARMRTPVVAAVNGTAAGAGFSLVCATDLAIAAESAKFTMAYTGAGLSPDGSSSYFLPRIIGQRRTLELMLTNRVLNSELALEWGLVNQVVPLDELMPAAEKLAGQLASGPERISVPQGTELVLRITSDHADELHLHGYDRALKLAAGVPGELRLVANLSGRFEYELHHAHTALGALEVQPQ